MNDLMPLSRERIKDLRDARAWSQAHLAEAAGLSLRTVQRVEAEGVASAETRLALAAAFDVPVESLNEPGRAVDAVVVQPSPPAIEPEPDQVSNGARVGMFVVSSAGVLFAMWLGSGLPPRVASHFGVAGDANGWMTRDHFVAAMCLLLTGLPLLMQGVLELSLKFGRVNIPNARYWLAPERRGETMRSLRVHFVWLSAGTSVFLAWVFWLVALANRAGAEHPALDSRTLLIGLAVMLAAKTAWIAWLGRRFKRGGAA